MADITCILMCVCMFCRGFRKLTLDVYVISYSNLKAYLYRRVTEELNCLKTISINIFFLFYMVLPLQVD